MNQNSSSFISLNISIVIVSDSRNESSDKSGKVLASRILEAGHKLIEKKIIRDEPKDIKSFLTISNKLRRICLKFYESLQKF